MELYDMIMKCENDGLGDLLDGKIKAANKQIVCYFRKTYGYGYHTSVALLRTGTMPGHEKKIIKEIVAEINENLGLNKGFSFVSGTVSYNISKFFKIDFSRLPYLKKYGSEKKISVQNADIRKGYADAIDNKDATCIECYDRFKTDRINHPANLCVCTKCAPNGVGYSESAHQSDVYSHAR